MTVVIHHLSSVAHETTAQENISDVNIDDVHDEVEDLADQILQHSISKISIMYSLP